MAESTLCGYCGDEVDADAPRITFEPGGVFHAVPCSLLYRLATIDSRVQALEQKVKGVVGAGDAAVDAAAFVRRLSGALEKLLRAEVSARDPALAGDSRFAAERDALLERETFLLLLFEALRGRTPPNAKPSPAHR